MLSHSLQSIEGSREPPPSYEAAVSSSDCSPASLEEPSTLTTQAALPEHFEVHYDVEPWKDLTLQNNHELVENLRHLTFQSVNLPALMKCASPPFKQLSRLKFIHTNIRFSPSEIERFSPFKLTLEHISFTTCSISKRLFAHLINYFPNLKSISIDGLSRSQPHEEKDLRTPRISRTLEKLTVNVGYWPNQNFLKALPKLGLKFNELDLKFFDPKNTRREEASSVIRRFGASAKCLRLPFLCHGKRNLLKSVEVNRDSNLLLDLVFENSALWRCLELREFELETKMDLCNKQDLQRIAAIKSRKIEKIILRPYIRSSNEVPWTRLDKILTNLARRLEDNKKQLEVQIRYDRGVRWGVFTELREQEISLPRFVEQGGRVTIWGLDNNLVYCSNAGKSRDSESL